MMSHSVESTFTRRDFLRTTGLAVAASVISLPRLGRSAPAAEIIETRVISHEPSNYHGWPTLTRRRNGQLLVVCSGSRESHVCPFGRVEMMMSVDDGKSWTWPQVLLDSPTDDRDAGVLETTRGTMLVTTFTSLAYVPGLMKARKLKAGEPGAWPAVKLEAWNGVHNRLNDAERKAELGNWMLRSTDGGRNWSPRIPTVLNSPHGPIQLADGRLLYPGVELWANPRRVGVAESTDDGLTWKWLAAIPARPGDNPGDYHELHGVESTPGSVIVQIRNHNKQNEGETLQSESTDGGRTWSVPRSIGVWGLPSFLLRLRSGKLLMTYGYRRKPFGNQARISDDGGRTWSEPMTISGDGIGVDLGYPSTAELEDGSLLTVWYEKMSSSPKAVLRQARWRVKA
jgi:hypothetical protein